MIYCDKCKHEFGPKVRTRYIQDDVEEVFFNCPSCHERYTAYYLNDKIRGLQGRLKQLQGRGSGTSFMQTQVQRHIKQEMNRLQEIYGTP